MSSTKSMQAFVGVEDHVWRNYSLDLGMLQHKHFPVVYSGSEVKGVGQQQVNPEAIDL